MLSLKGFMALLSDIPNEIIEHKETLAKPENKSAPLGTCLSTICIVYLFPTPGGAGKDDQAGSKQPYGCRHRHGCNTNQ